MMAPKENGARTKIITKEHFVLIEVITVGLLQHPQRPPQLAPPPSPPPVLLSACCVRETTPSCDDGVVLAVQQLVDIIIQNTRHNVT